MDETDIGLPTPKISKHSVLKYPFNKVIVRCRRHNCGYFKGEQCLRCFPPPPPPKPTKLTKGITQNNLGILLRSGMPVSKSKPDKSLPLYMTRDVSVPALNKCKYCNQPCPSHKKVCRDPICVRARVPAKYMVRDDLLGPESSKDEINKVRANLGLPPLGVGDFDLPPFIDP